MPRCGRTLMVGLLALIAVGTSASDAVSASLAGRLREVVTLNPVEHACVRLLENGRMACSNPDGIFVFEALPAGRYTLSVHHVAYADLERAVVVTDSLMDDLLIDLSPTVFLADEIIVRSSRSLASMRRTPYALDARTAEAIRERPVVTAPEAFALMPGLTLVRDGAWETAISIRGMGRSSIVALVDHTRIETATDISGGLSLIDMNELERIEVMKSAGSVLFGSGALGGAVQMISRRAPFSDTPRWAGEWMSGGRSVDGGVAHHLALEHSAGRHALRVSGGHRRAGDTDTPAGPIADSRYQDWSVNGSLGLRTFAGQSMLISYQRVQAEDTGIPGGSPIAITATARYPMARRELIALQYTMPNLSASVPLLTCRLAHQDIVREVEIVQNPTVTVTPHAVHATTSGQLEARLLPARAHVLVAGLDVWQRDLDSRRERRLQSTDQIIGERPVPRAQYLSAGIYAQDEWELAADRLRVVLGARYDFGRTHNDSTRSPEYIITSGELEPNPPGQEVLWEDRTTSEGSWDADAGFHYVLTPHLAATFMIASAFRSPSLEERFQFIDLGSIVRLGDPLLLPEQSLAVNVGLRLQSNRGSLRSDFFINSLTDLVTELPATWQGRPALVKSNVGEARISGFELEGELRLARGTAVWAALAYARGEDTRADTPLPQIAPLTGRVEVHTEVAPAGSVLVACVATGAQDNPGPGETVTPGFTVWDAGFVSTPLKAGGVTCTLRTGVRNAFDRAYRQHLSTLRGVVKLEPGRDLYASITVSLP